MKNKLKVVFLTIFSVCLLFLTGACTKGNNSSVEPEPEPVEKTKISLDCSAVELERLETATLTALFEGEQIESVIWSSSNESVATVSDGVVNAVGAGSAVVSCSYDGTEARCLVRVTDNSLLPGITTNIGLNDSLYLIVGDDFTLDYEVTYNTKEIFDAEVSVQLSENNSVEFVEGKLKAKQTGESTLTLTASWKGLSHSVVIDVFVVENAYASLWNETSLTLYNDSRGGNTTVRLSPIFVESDNRLTNEDYTIIEWEYDETIVSVDETNLTVESVEKGETELVATLKSNKTGTIVQACLPICVELYQEDRTETITLPTLYLNRSEYYLDILDIFVDKTEEELTGLEIIEIVDITGGVTYDIAIDNGVVKVENVEKLGVSGDRKWKVECKKFSYVVSVSIVDVDPAAEIVGKYTSADWEYLLEMTYEYNSIVAVFKNKQTGDIVDFGYCSTTAWKNNDYKAGKITIQMNGTAVSTHPIKCYYFYSSGCWQMNLALNNSDTYSKELFGEDIVAPYEALAGVYYNDDLWSISYKLDADGACEMEGIDGFEFSSVGTYKLLPDTPLSGKIIMTYETAFKNGQTVFEGNYSYSAGGAKFNLYVDGMASPKKNFAQVGENDVYEEFAGYYSSKRMGDGWDISFRFLADGTCIFDYQSWTAHSSIGKYVLKDGKLVISMISDYAGLKNYEGTYEDRDGVKYFIFEIIHAPTDLREFIKQ